MFAELPVYTSSDEESCPPTPEPKTSKGAVWSEDSDSWADDIPEDKNTTPSASFAAVTTPQDTSDDKGFQPVPTNKGKGKSKRLPKTPASPVSATAPTPSPAAASSAASAASAAYQGQETQEPDVDNSYDDLWYATTTMPGTIPNDDIAAKMAKGICIKKELGFVDSSEVIGQTSSGAYIVQLAFSELYNKGEKLFGHLNGLREANTPYHLDFVKMPYEDNRGNKRYLKFRLPDHEVSSTDSADFILGTDEK